MREPQEALLAEQEELPLLVLHLHPVVAVVAMELTTQTLQKRGVMEALAVAVGMEQQAALT